MVVAICDDKYHANYPRAYIAAHHPLLVLKVNGEAPARLAERSRNAQFNMGPYMISHPKFTPSFKILAHSDEAQIPWGVVRLEFRDEKTVFGAIAPRGPHAGRCSGAGGLPDRAAELLPLPQHGARRRTEVRTSLAGAGGVGARRRQNISPLTCAIRKKKNPHAEMPAIPSYDDATIGALRDYFQTFARAGETMTLRMAKDAAGFRGGAFLFVRGVSTI